MPASLAIVAGLPGGFPLANAVAVAVAAVAAAAIAAAIVAWWPGWAEFVARHLVGWKALAAAVVLAVAVPLLPAAVRPPVVVAALASALVAIPLVIGILLFPAELRGARPLPAPSAPPAQAPLLGRLRAAWSSLCEECPPAAIDMARIALAAYETPGEWRSTVPALGFSDHVPVVRGSAKAVVMIAGDEAVVAFQGTDDVGDWLVNLDGAVARPPDDPVHRGFLAVYRSVADQVHAALAASRIEHVWITGHSLGGAMGVLCGLDLVRGGNHDASREGGHAGRIDVRGVITFGQPLLLAPRFAVKANELLSGRHLRFIHEDDIVTRVLPGMRGGGSSIWFRDGEPVFATPRMMAPATGRQDAGGVELGVEPGPAPLTSGQFEEEKRRIREGRAAAARPGDEAIARVLPTARDHPMTLYLAAVVKHFSGGSAAG